VYGVWVPGGCGGFLCEEWLGLVPAGSNSPAAGHNPAPRPPWQRLGRVRVRKGKTFDRERNEGETSEREPWEREKG